MGKFPTTLEQRQKLLSAGFVRVDGLKVSRQGRNRREKIILMVEPRNEYLGCWDRQNGLLVLYTLGREIWLAMNTIEPTEERAVKIDELQSELCPNGRGAPVPASNGDKFAWREILRRMANPDW